jgi:hypothetical protein
MYDSIQNQKPFTYYDNNCFIILYFVSGKVEQNESVTRTSGLNHTSESSVRAKYTIYLPSFLAAIHYYVAFPLVDILFITKEPLLIPKVSRNE